MPSITAGILVLAGSVFALHALIRCYCVLRVDGDSNRPAELVWTLLPLLVVTVLFVMALRGGDGRQAPALEAQKQPAPQQLERLAHLHTRDE